MQLSTAVVLNVTIPVMNTCQIANAVIVVVIAGKVCGEWSSLRIDFLNQNERGNQNAGLHQVVNLLFLCPLPVYLDCQR